MRIRNEIRHPYDKVKGCGTPLRKEDYKTAEEYFEAAMNVLNRDVGIAHARLRRRSIIDKILIAVAVSLITGIASSIKEFVCHTAAGVIK